MRKRVRKVDEPGAGAGAAGGGEVRGRLLSEATELFANRGYSATTVREIVEHAGVTKPVLYYYFRNKEGLFLELMGDPFRKFAAVVEGTVSEEGTAKERLFRLCLRAFDIFLENLDVARVMYSIYYGPPQGAPFIDFDAYHLHFQEAVLRIVEEGIRDGEFRRGDAGDAMWAVLGAVNVGMELELCRPSQGLGRKGIRRVLEVILAGVAGGEKSGTGKGRRG